eukprot:1336181-Rhodomonas_salina.3
MGNRTLALHHLPRPPGRPNSCVRALVTEGLWTLAATFASAGTNGAYATTNSQYTFLYRSMTGIGFRYCAASQRAKLWRRGQNPAFLFCCLNSPRHCRRALFFVAASVPAFLCAEWHLPRMAAQAQKCQLCEDTVATLYCKQCNEIFCVEVSPASPSHRCRGFRLRHPCRPTQLRSTTSTSSADFSEQEG